jgi:CrcB protein
MAVVAVALGGALGALGRYGVALLMRAWVPAEGAAGPLATLTVNVVGSLLLAWLIFSTDLELSPTVRLGLATGVLGAFTTFSTFELDLYRLLDGRAGWGAAYLAANLVLGFGAVMLGRALALRS